MKRTERYPLERWGRRERAEPKAGGEGVKVHESERRGKGGGGAWPEMFSREGGGPAVSCLAPQTWTSAARRTSARAASAPTRTALSSASVLRDTARARTSLPASVRGPAPALPPRPAASGSRAHLPSPPLFHCCLPSHFLCLPPSPGLLSPFLDSSPRPFFSFPSPLPSLPPSDCLSPPSDIDECRERGPALCGSQRCENSPGSYRCVRDCDPGYHAGPEGTCDGETTAPPPDEELLKLTLLGTKERLQAPRTWRGEKELLTNADGEDVPIRKQAKPCFQKPHAPLGSRTVHISDYTPGRHLTVRA